MLINLKHRKKLGVGLALERSTGKTLDDDKVDRMIGSLLRTGVVVSALIVLAGAVLHLAHYGAAMPDYHTFRGEPAALTCIGGICRNVLGLQPLSLIQLGLVVLILTPLARVLFALVAFAVQRDILYVFVSLIVLGVLIYSITVGI
ncbi:MAG: DUF1634 domain-containing protein [Syntrophobacteraceae bacterium]